MNPRLAKSQPMEGDLHLEAGRNRAQKNPGAEV